MLCNIVSYLLLSQATETDYKNLTSNYLTSDILNFIKNIVSEKIDKQTLEQNTDIKNYNTLKEYDAELYDFYQSKLTNKKQIYSTAEFSLMVFFEDNLSENIEKDSTDLKIVFKRYMVYFLAKAFKAMREDGEGDGASDVYDLAKFFNTYNDFFKDEYFDTEMANLNKFLDDIQSKYALRNQVAYHSKFKDDVFSLYKELTA